MKRDEVRAIFSDATEDQIDALLNRVGADINPLKAARNDAEEKLQALTGKHEQFERENAELRIKLEEANKLAEAGMSAEELLQKSREEQDRREAEFNKRVNALDAKELFVNAGCFSPEEVGALVDQVVCEDPERTKQAATLIVNTVIAQREATEKAVRDQLLKSNPKPQGGDSGAPAPMTKKDFFALTDAEQIALKQENPQILSQLRD